MNWINVLYALALGFVTKWVLISHGVALNDGWGGATGYALISAAWCLLLEGADND